MELVHALRNCQANMCCLNNENLTPIHLAAAKGQEHVVESLLEHDKELLRCLSPSTGHRPLHVAAIHMQRGCVELLIKKGADVTEQTPQMKKNKSTIIHLVASKAAHRRLELSSRARSTATNPLESQSSTEQEEEESKVIDLLSILLDCMKVQMLDNQMVSVIMDAQLGTALHYFAAINYADGIRIFAGQERKHPPDKLNAAGCSALVVGLKCRALKAVTALLEHEVDVNRVEPEQQLKPLQLLLTDIDDGLKIQDEHLEIVDKLLEKGIFFYPKSPTHRICIQQEGKRGGGRLFFARIEPN